MRKWVAFVTLICFLLTATGVRAESVLLPAPGQMVGLSSAFQAPLLKGIKVDRENPFRLEFILDQGDSSASAEELRAESSRLIKYFLTSVTVPEKDLWVNLSPYERERIVPEAFGVTEMGRDVLAQDYLLKQVTASVIYPEGEIGRAFWARVYKAVYAKYGTTDIPLDTFNKVWIVPEKAVVYENQKAAYVIKSRLKVMLETDYFATQVSTSTPNPTIAPNEIAKNILREVVIPILENEINEGKNFAQLRQVYSALILAVWYKDKVRETVFGGAYVDQRKTGGVDIENRKEKEQIWAQYVEAFRKGSFNYIKDDLDPAAQQAVPRKYFSGGVGFSGIVDPLVYRTTRDRAKFDAGSSSHTMVVVKIDMAMIDGAQMNVDAGQTARPDKTENFFKKLIALESQPNRAYSLVNKALVAVLTAIYSKMVEKGLLTIDSLEARLMSASGGQAVKDAIENVLGLHYVKSVEQNEITIGTLEARLENVYLRHVVVNALGVHYLNMVEEGTMTIGALEARLEVDNRYGRQAVVHALGLLYSRMVKQGRAISLDVLRARINKEHDSAVERALVDVVLMFDEKMVEQGRMTLDMFENRWRAVEGNQSLQQALELLGKLYLRKLEQGQVSAEVMEAFLKREPNLDVVPQIIKGSGSLYLKMVVQGQTTKEALELRLMTEEDWKVRRAIMNGLVLIYLHLIEQGRWTKDGLESRLRTLGDSELRLANHEALIALYISLVEQEKLTIEALESEYKIEAVNVRCAIALTLGTLYLRRVEQGQMTMEAFEARAEKSANDSLIEPAFRNALNTLRIKLGKMAIVDMEALEKVEYDSEALRNIGNALTLLYIREVEQGRMTIGDLEFRLKSARMVVQCAIVNALGALCLRMVEQGQTGPEAIKQYEFWDRRGLLVLGNAYVLDWVSGLDVPSVEREDALLTDVVSALDEANKGSSEDRQISRDVFQREYLPLVGALEAFLPGQGAQYITASLKNNGGVPVVVRFLGSKQSFLRNGAAMQALRGVLERMRVEHEKISRKAFRVDMTTLFKVINTMAGFIDLGKGRRCVEILNALSEPMSVTDLAKHLEGLFMGELASYLEVPAEAVSAEAGQSLYMPYLSRIRDALLFIKGNTPEKYERFRALVAAMLQGRFWVFIEDTEQANEQGKLIAQHNKLVREALAGAGIDVERWLGRAGNSRMPEGAFLYHENSMQEYDPVADAGVVANYIVNTLNAELEPDQREALMQFLKQSGLAAVRDPRGLVSAIRVVGAAKKRDIVSAIAERTNLKMLLAIQSRLVSAENVQHNVPLLEMVTHLGERIATLQARMDNPEYQKDLGKQRRHFLVRPILRNPGHDLFIGDFTNCCLGMNSNQYPDAMMDRLIDEGLNVLEVIDEDTQKTMAAAWLYIATDGSLVIQNLEINADYERIEPLMNAVGSGMVEYARQFAQHIGARRFLIGQPGHGKYFGSGGFVENRYGKQEVDYGLDKIGGYLGGKYYLDSTGAAKAYLVPFDSSMAGAPAVGLIDEVGGIDLARDKLDLRLEGEGPGVKFDLDPAMIRQLQSSVGLAPIIVDISPLLVALPEFMGLSDNAPIAVPSP
ncbi:MAG: hypothetical protein HQL20_03555 [Candidatus Omnitrophica bacterium]|nr:hypothetical protein [Candidatus Omnitrophota bacterium]